MTTGSWPPPPFDPTPVSRFPLDTTRWRRDLERHKFGIANVALTEALIVALDEIEILRGLEVPGVTLLELEDSMKDIPVSGGFSQQSTPRTVAREEVASLCGLILRRLQDAASKHAIGDEGLVRIADLNIIFGEALADFTSDTQAPGS